MRGIINYIRSCFCKHEMELIWENKHQEACYWGVFRCKKCGYIQKISH